MKKLILGFINQTITKNMKKWLINKILKSKKFWYTIAGIVVPVIAHEAGLPLELVLTMAATIIALIFGQGLADSGKEREKIKAAIRKKINKKQGINN